MIQEVYEIDIRTVIVSYILRFFLYKEASTELDETLLSDPEGDGEEDWNLKLQQLGEWRLCNTQTNTDLGDFYKNTQNPFPRYWATAPT